MARPKKGTGRIEFSREACDAIKDGKPDLYNGVAKRVIEAEESLKMGWPHYYDGKTACPQGHVAARYVSNPAICVDCHRIGAGKPPIYPRTEFTDDLTGQPIYVDPRASDRFAWTESLKGQFLTAWINTTSIPKALNLIKAQPTHLIDLLERDAQFKAEYEAAERKVSLVQQWSLEGEAADGSDRVKLALGSNKFASFGAKTGLAGRPTVNAEEARAELAQILRTARQSLDQRERLAAVARANGALARSDGAPAAAADDLVEESAVLGPPYDNSDLVSDS
jgi:hypothetical protein